MSKIGFKLASNTDNKDEIEVQELRLMANTDLEDMLMEYFDPPQWEIDYRKSLFWAAIFNTHDKEHKC